MMPKTEYENLGRVENSQIVICVISHMINDETWLRKVLLSAASERKLRDLFKADALIRHDMEHWTPRAFEKYLRLRVWWEIKGAALEVKLARECFAARKVRDLITQGNLHRCCKPRSEQQKHDASSFYWVSLISIFSVVCCIITPCLLAPSSSCRNELRI